MQYLKAARQREADLADTALTPESIIGTNSEWQEAWPIDYGQGIPQGDASSLPVDRSMQQPRDHTWEHNTDALFNNIRDLKQKLYGTDANVTIRGKRDLATAAAEIDRYDCQYTIRVLLQCIGTKHVWFGTLCTSASSVPLVQLPLLQCFSIFSLLTMTNGRVCCCRLCAAVGVPATDQISHTAKTLRDKLDAVRAEVG